MLSRLIPFICQTSVPEQPPFFVRYWGVLAFAVVCTLETVWFLYRFLYRKPEHVRKDEFDDFTRGQKAALADLREELKQQLQTFAESIQSQISEMKRADESLATELHRTQNAFTRETSALTAAVEALKEARREMMDFITHLRAGGPRVVKS